MCSQRSARFARAKENREETKHDAQEHNLAGRYVFGSPFHKDEIASPDHSEQGKSKISGFFHLMGHHGPAAHCYAAGLTAVSCSARRPFAAQ
jgi:hypothetical protein